jgi:hypothetical protein
MHRASFLIVTAIFEAGTGLSLLVMPSVPTALLLGVKDISPELGVCARIAGGALFSLGIACWLGRGDRRSSAQLGLLLGVLFYDLTAAIVLACAGSLLGFIGIALWPGVMAHSGLAVWCIGCLSNGRPWREPGKD